MKQSVTIVLPVVYMVSFKGTATRWQQTGRNMSKAQIKPEKKETATASSGTDSRAFRRRSVLWPAHLVVGRHRIACQVWNLSLAGARVRVDLPVKEGTEVTLSIRDRGDVKAEVVWTENGAMGLSFHVAASVIKRMFQDRLHILGLDESKGI